MRDVFTKYGTIELYGKVREALGELQRRGTESFGRRLAGFGEQ